MALIYSETRLADVIANETSVIPVINRFGINLGTGDATVDAVCRVHKLDTDFFSPYSIRLSTKVISRKKNCVVSKLRK